MGLATSKARAALADHVTPRADAIFNHAAGASLVHALQTNDFERLREGVRDRWHQPARVALVPLSVTCSTSKTPMCWVRSCRAPGRRLRVLARQNFGRLEQLLSSMYASAGHRGRVVRTVRPCIALAAERQRGAPLSAGDEEYEIRLLG